jgi:hypothetical protein
MVTVLGCASPEEGDPMGVEPMATETGSDTDAADTESAAFDCFDRNDAPENDYVTDDPRLSDREYAWSADALRRGSECVDCHRFPDSMKSPAEIYWDIECQPTWTDSATDDTLQKILVVLGDSSESRITLDASARERVAAVIESELQRRADRR